MVSRRSGMRGTFVVREDQELNIFDRGVTKGYLKKIPVIAGLRLATVVAMALSWLALVSHCELAAATAPKLTPTHSCCEKDKAGEKAPRKDDQHNNTECCKAGHPALAPIAKKAASQEVSFSAHSYFIGLAIFPDVSISASILEFDNGPPFASSFAEVVL